MAKTGFPSVKVTAVVCWISRHCKLRMQLRYFSANHLTLNLIAIFSVCVLTKSLQMSPNT